MLQNPFPSPSILQLESEMNAICMESQYLQLLTVHTNDNTTSHTGPQRFEWVDHHQ